MSYDIRDIFHAFAYATDDFYARRNIHGLNVEYLKEHGFKCEADLLSAFKVWLSYKDVSLSFANDPKKESKFLELSVIDIGLPPWLEREKCAEHKIAFNFKRHETSVGQKFCTHKIHSDYHPHCLPSNATDSLISRRKWGHHCSLYDAYEIYLFAMTNS